MLFTSPVGAFNVVAECIYVYIMLVYYWFFKFLEMPCLVFYDSHRPYGL